jgi:hypothetical protein
VLASTLLVLGSIIEDIALFLAATRTYLFSFVNIRDNSKGTGTYYAVAEESPKDNIPPMLLEITINGGNKIHIKRIRALPGDSKSVFCKPKRST